MNDNERDQADPSIADGLMVEGRSRLSVLVIEDHPEFRANALRALDGHSLVVRSNAEEAEEALRSIKFDAMLSGARFRKNGSEAAPSVSRILELCRFHDVPLCLVARTDDEGRLDADGSSIRLSSTTVGLVVETQIVTSRYGASEEKMFSALRCSDIRRIESCSKTPEVWAIALQMALSAGARIGEYDRVVRKLRMKGEDVIGEDGMPKVIPRR